MKDWREQRAEEFAQRMFATDNLSKVDMRDNANWRRFLEAVDYAIDSHPKVGSGTTFTETEEES